MAFHPDPSARRYFHSATVCLSALLAAGRHQELLDLLGDDPRTIWHYRQYTRREFMTSVLGRELGLE